MENVVLLLSIIFFYYVMRKKKIPIVSLYGIFGLQWFYYLLFPFLSVNNFIPAPFPTGTPLNHDVRVVSYFLLFNAIFMLIFSFIFLVIFKPNDTIKKEVSAKDEKYKTALFFILLLLDIFLIYIGYKYRYSYVAVVHTIHANLRNIFVGLFAFYMMIETRRLKIYFLYFLFIVATFFLGSRIFLAIITAILFVYLFDVGVIDLKKGVALLLVAITAFSLIGVVRVGFYSIEKISYYLWHPLILESLYSGYSGLALTEMWLDGKIKYYNYFGSYYIDPLMIFVPQMVFIGAGIPKASYNVLGKWEEDHGGRDKISPKGSYYYLAEAIEAAGFWGIILVSTGFAVICAKMEKLRAGNIFNRFIYYSFFGAFGFGFVKAQFSWCARYFIQNIFTLALFFLMYKVFYDVAKNVRDQSNGKISGQTIV